ncbi:MAG: NAD-dependent epimerase/dehydratase family protein [Syntrophales bacterium]
MHCLVLGGAGFIGSHIVDALVARNHRVRIFDLPNINTQNLQQCIDRVEVLGGDFNNVNDISPALEGVDVVVHLVGTTLPGPSNENPAYDVESNVIGTLNLLKQVVAKGVKKIIFSSSGGTVYGIPRSVPIPETHETNPICSYGITKLTIEKYLALFHHLHNLDYTILRLANPYGERQRTDAVQGAVAVFLGKTLSGQPITIWGDGSVARDYFYIGDLVDAFVKVVESDAPANIYNIGSGRARSMNDILSVIRDVTGRQPMVQYTPGRKLDVPVNCLDIQLAKKDLGWQPAVSWEEGIARTWEWLKKAKEGCRE